MFKSEERSCEGYSLATDGFNAMLGEALSRMLYAWYKMHPREGQLMKAFLDNKT